MLPASQPQGAQPEPVSGGVRFAQSAVETGSLFLFDVPNPEKVVGSSAPPADDGSAMKAHSLPGDSSQSGMELLFASFFVTLVPEGPVAVKRSV